MPATTLPAWALTEAGRKAIAQERARKGFLRFVEWTNKKYRADRVHQFVAARLQAFVEAVERGESPRLMLFMPPQEGKSELVSRRLTPWVLGRHPDWRVILVSYGAELAETMSKAARRCVDSDPFKEIYPDLKLDPLSTAVADWTLDSHEGGMRALGVGGGITGQSAEILIVDDPVKGRNEVDRDTYRDEQWSWWPQAIDRVQEGGGVIILCTRWHHDDLPGRLLKQAAEDPAVEQWEVIKLRAIANDEVDPLGREPGEGLGGRHSVEWFLRTKAALPERDWSAKFDQEPTPDEGNIFKAEWLRFEEPPQKLHGWVFQAADTAFSEKKKAAYTCVETWCVEGNAYRLLDVYRQRVGFPSLVDDVVGLAATFHPLAIVIEDKASGMSLLQVLAKETRLPVLPWQPHGDKATRAHAVTPVFRAKRVILPPAEHAPWVKEWVKEHLQFPTTEYKDQVDTTSLALLWAAEQGGAFDQQPTTVKTHDFTWNAGDGETDGGAMQSLLDQLSGVPQMKAELERRKAERERALVGRR